MDAIFILGLVQQEVENDKGILLLSFSISLTLILNEV